LDNSNSTLVSFAETATSAQALASLLALRVVNTSWSFSQVSQNAFLKFQKSAHGEFGSLPFSAHPSQELSHFADAGNRVQAKRLPREGEDTMAPATSPSPTRLFGFG
jgi:hypothetical protein